MGGKEGREGELDLKFRAVGLGVCFLRSSEFFARIGMEDKKVVIDRTEKMINDEKK